MLRSALLRWSPRVSALPPRLTPSLAATVSSRLAGVSPNSAFRFYSTEKDTAPPADQAQTPPKSETKSTSTDQATAASEGEAKKAEATGKPSAEKQLAELKDHYLRCLADMENLRQRTKVEVEKSSKFAIHKFAKELLDTVDILSMALNAVPEDHRADSANHAHLSNLYDGVNMTQSELLKTLKRHGVEPFSPMDEAFDPNKHQAMYQVTIPGKAPGTVISVEKSGYLLHGRVMRPAQVGITKIEN